MPRESKKARIARMHQEYEQLCVEIPDPKCALNFNSPFELLVATVLSAQTTDKRVNMVTPELFGEYPGPAELAAANPEHVEDIIRTIGFFRTKARNIIGLSHELCVRFGGEVPADMASLISLPGVGRERGVGQRVRRARFSCGHACDSCDWAIAVAVRLGEPLP